MADTASTSIDTKERSCSFLGLSCWKTVAQVLLFGTLVAAELPSDAGVPFDQAPTAQANTAASTRSKQPKDPYPYTKG